jgi:hypothetical protein
MGAQSLNFYFSQKLSPLACDENTKNYIIGIFGKYLNSQYDLSKESITLKYSQAKFNNSFITFQTIADWLFFANVLFPESFTGASAEYYTSIGRLSYYQCYKMIREWLVYEKIADDFIPLSNNCKNLINHQTFESDSFLIFEK